jgi:hypothetical protein
VSEERVVANSLDGWLAAALPESARSFRAADPRLAGVLRDAGAEQAQAAPDVEIAPVAELTGDARHAIVSIDAAQAEGGSRLVRAPRRMAATLEARARARGAARALRRAGYGTTSTILWDVDHLLLVPHVRAPLRDRPFAEWLPERALVTGSRHGPERTALQAAVAAAGRAAGAPLRHGWPLARAAGVVVVADGGVVHVAVGPGRRKFELQEAVLRRLGDAPAAVTGRLPRTIAVGRSGLADWTLEGLMPGDSPHGELPASLTADAVEFLVALFAHGQNAANGASIAADARVLAAVCADPAAAERLRALGDRLEVELADLPRGFGHGDFWSKNLLAVDGRLAGVIDWDGAGGGRLPLLDLLHLLLSAHRERTREYLGAALTGHLLPWLRAGGDEVVRGYLSRLGIEPRPELLERLAIAYWLDRMALEVSQFADRAGRPVWLRRNVDDVAAALAASPPLPL